MTSLVGMSGSLRQGSFNAALLRAAAESVPPGAQLEIASLRDVPLYDGDVEARDGIPPAVRDLKEKLAGVQGLLLVTPEYNNSIPGVFKNAIDWMSRPPADIPRVFGDRPVAVMGATTGKGGTLLAQTAWLPVLRALGTRPWFGPRMAVGDARHVFDGSGRLVDEPLRARLQQFMAGFVEFVRVNARSVS